MTTQSEGEIPRIGFPARSAVLRRSLARRNICPECGGELDTGWECNDCDYDAQIEATTTGTITSAELKAIGQHSASAVRFKKPYDPR